MLPVIIFGLAIALVHVNGDSHTGGCTATYTTTCPINPPIPTSCSCNNLVIEKRFKQLVTKMNQIEAKLDHLMAHANITEEIKTNWPDSLTITS